MCLLKLCKWSKSVFLVAFGVLGCHLGVYFQCYGTLKVGKHILNLYYINGVFIFGGRSVSLGLYFCVMKSFLV